MIKPAIIVVGYNRPEGVKRLLDSIGNASYEVDGISLIISIDESNKSDDVELVAQQFSWKYGSKEILRYSKRLGLKQHIIQCGDLSKKYGSVIILEDDLIVAKDFYTFVCKAHEFYSSNEVICGISLYSYSYNVFTHYIFSPTPSECDVYMGGMIVTWGQSWTFKQWNDFKLWFFEHEGKLPKINPNIPRDISSWKKSWGIYFANYMAEKKKKYIYPFVSRTTCFSDYGEHNSSEIPFTYVQVPLMSGLVKEYRFLPIDQLEVFDAFYEKVFCNDKLICGIPCNQICVDLNNMKTHAEQKKYVLTNEKLSFPKIASFGLTLKPIFLNVTENISGNQIFLYELKKGDDCIRKWRGKRPNFYYNLRRLKYEFHDVSWRLLVYYAPSEFFVRLKDIVKNMLRMKV